jgi:hypothetical protein
MGVLLVMQPFPSVGRCTGGVPSSDRDWRLARAGPLWPIFRIYELTAEAFLKAFGVCALGKTEDAYVHAEAQSAEIHRCHRYDLGPNTRCGELKSEPAPQGPRPGVR